MPRWFSVYLVSRLQFPWVIFVIKRHEINRVFCLFRTKIKFNDLNSRTKWLSTTYYCHKLIVDNAPEYVHLLL